MIDRDGKTPIPHFSDRLTGMHISMLINNARRLASRSMKRERNWVMAMDLFGAGSTMAHHICRRAGLKPDATK